MGSKTSQDTVARHIVDGIRPLSVIASLTGWPESEIKDLAREMGYALNVSSQKFQRPAQPKPKPTGVVLANASERTAPRAEPQDWVGQAPVRPATRDLIEEGRASSNARVRHLADKAQQALDTLAEHVIAHREAEAEKRAKVEREAEARRRIAELEAQIAKEKEALRGDRPIRARTTEPKAGAKRGPIGVDYRELDEWCQANGHPWRKFGHGRPTNELIEAFRAAQAGAA
jgi:hypothetical protein